MHISKNTKIYVILPLLLFLLSAVAFKQELLNTSSWGWPKTVYVSYAITPQANDGCDKYKNVTETYQFCKDQTIPAPKNSVMWLNAIDDLIFSLVAVVVGRYLAGFLGSIKRSGKKPQAIPINAPMWACLVIWASFYIYLLLSTAVVDCSGTRVSLISGGVALLLIILSPLASIYFLWDKTKLAVSAIGSASIVILSLAVLSHAFGNALACIPMF